MIDSWFDTVVADKRLSISAKKLANTICREFPSVHPQYVSFRDNAAANLLGVDPHTVFLWRTELERHGYLVELENRTGNYKLEGGANG